MADLALARMLEISSTDTNEIIVPWYHQDSIWRGLSAIFNTNSFSARDSIFDMFCIHDRINYASPSYPAIYIRYDTTISWTHNWQINQLVTGYSELDEFIAEYEYYIQASDPNYNFLVLNTQMLLNPSPVAELFSDFEGIVIAIPELITSNGSRIQYQVINGFQLFDFTLAWGDSLAGCVNNHTWSFRVDPGNCVVEYLGLDSYVLSDFPDPINCNITSIEDDLPSLNSAISIFPNPASDIITITGKELTEVEVWNGYHYVESYHSKQKNTLTLDLHLFKPGLYFVKVESKHTSIVHKLVLR